MDVIAHSLSGVLVGRAGAARDDARERKFYLTVGGGAFLFPDIDAVSYLWGPDAFALIHQRYTHTIFALILFPPLLAFAFRFLFRDRSWKTIYLLVLAGMSIHIAEDLIAHWPVEFFYPLSGKGLSFGLIREDFSLVVDFILIGGSMLTFYDRFVPHRRLVSIGTFIVLGLYLFLGPGI